jgi:hypothetical protein
MKKSIIVFFIAMLAAGCTKIPFQEADLTPLDNRDPRSIREHFQAGIPTSFQLLTTVVFEYNGRTFSGIGTVDINTNDRTFRVACLNPMGVKLFEISGSAHAVTNHFVIAAIAQYGDVGTVAGNDVRRIYFDLIPSPNAPVWKRKYSYRYRQFSDAGYLEYVFAGTDGNLIEKTYFEDHLPVWSVSYYEYREQKGKRYPQGIVFINYQYGYRLTVRQKELFFEKNQE